MLYSIMLENCRQASNDEYLRQIASLKPSYESLFKKIIECANFIESYENRGFFGDYGLPFVFR